MYFYQKPIINNNFILVIIPNFFLVSPFQVKIIFIIYFLFNFLIFFQFPTKEFHFKFQNLQINLDKIN